jgi:serine phosphatase RsbU (regulator of sigma subunit)
VNRTCSGSGSRRPGDIIRRIPALWIAAITLKLLVWLTAPDQLALDRAVNFALIVLAAATVYRLMTLARSGILWRVSRKLILSYILVGAVPILLLVTFSLLAFLLIFFDIGSYLVQSRLSALSDQAATIATTTMFEIEGDPASRREIAARRQHAIATRFSGVSVSVVPSGELPSWLKAESFAGLVMAGQRMVVRAVAFPRERPAAYAVIVDLPVADLADATDLAPAGITVGAKRRQSFFNTATFLNHTDWLTGAIERTPLPMSVDVPALYRFLGRSQEGGNALSFNQLLLYALIGIGALLLVIEVVALGNGVALARSITSSVDELFRGTERVKSGEFGHPIAVRSDDQLGLLAASFNDMTVRIEALLREQDEKRRLAEELRIARDIQMSLLPQGPFHVEGLSLAAMCAPAREVGGDYFDLLPLSGDRLGVLIADVSGKGTSAALYMAELKGLMLSLSQIHSSPRALLIDANRIISRHLDSRSFITMTYALVDRRAGTLTCARAGHCPFIRIPAAHRDDRRAEILAPDGMVLGLNLDGGERFERYLDEISMPLERGDLFFFFTDGISETMDSEGDCFGEMRVASFLESNALHPPEAIRDRLVEELAAFAQGQPQHDDVTMIILKIE